MCQRIFPIEDVFKWLSEMGISTSKKTGRKLKMGSATFGQFPDGHVTAWNMSASPGKKHHVSWAFFPDPCSLLVVSEGFPVGPKLWPLRLKSLDLLFSSCLHDRSQAWDWYGFVWKLSTPFHRLVNHHFTHQEQFRGYTDQFSDPHSSRERSHESPSNPMKSLLFMHQSA